MSKSFLIAAPWSNSGKTTITLGLARYLHNKGLNVQTFKCGPDYIDTIHHTTASGNPSVNLDTVMMSDEHVKNLFNTYSSVADICILEGVMGLFDGAVKDWGSSAELAKKLNLPILLVVNAKAMAYSIAPILLGLKTFDPEVHIAGVVFNCVKTASHYAFLKEACETVGLPPLGYVPPNDKIEIPSRHLGLDIEDAFDPLIETAAKHVGTSINVERLIRDITKDFQPQKLAESIEPITHLQVDKSTRKSLSDTTIAVAKDEAFRFTYLENLNQLGKLGRIVFFSPIHDEIVPEADFIYLAGGYPELYLEKLARNTKMKIALKEAADKGIKILGECGGMMYLGKHIINEKGISFPMVGVFDFSTSMKHKRLHLGYRRVVFEQEEIWGHEFHYSSIQEDSEESIAHVYTARDKEVHTKVYTYKNVLASYIHFYWGAGNFKWINELATKKFYPSTKEK